ncbi:MAG TPA: polymer-forming cytoskeletal protein [Vicinamibacterales bacterium]|nr:polymer-forming cytoskeletal protein [Vicinamibacterales bacterium]
MTTIGHSITIKGEVSSDEALRVDGNVRGQILMRDAELTIGPSARVDADLRATRVLVLGTVRGNIAASTRVELGASSNVTGDITADTVVLVEGARFQGRVDMDRRTIAARVAQYRAGQGAIAQ